MARFNRSDPVADQDLIDYLNVEQAKLITPMSSSGELQFVHPFTTLSLLRRVQFETQVSAAGVANINSSTTPANRYRYILAADMFHNDATSRESAISLFHPINLTQASIVQSGRALPTSTSLAILRPFLLPQNHVLRADVAAIAVGNTVTLRFYFVELKHAETPPNF